MARFRMLSSLAPLTSLFTIAALNLARPCGASAPRYPDIMPLSQVKAGMHGYGLTVFRGTKVERFDVAVVGVVKKGSLAAPGHDMILVRMFGGPITSRHAYLIRGMSGSPVYINGKIVGAFSQGEPTAKEPLGGVTPIEDMLEAWDPRLPESPLTSLAPDNKIRATVLNEPIQLGDRVVRKVLSNVPLSSGLRSHGDTLVLHPCTTFAGFTSPSETARKKLAKALEPYHVELMKGVAGGTDSSFKGAPLVPGSAFSMMLVTGDMTVGATGTVTYRKGNRILGFGHPFMGIGAIDAPLCSAYIYDVYPLLAGSYKIASSGPIVGTSAQDTPFAISGTIGKQPRTIPITVDVRDKTTGRSRVFHSQAVSHPNLFSAMVSATVGASIAEVRNTPGPAMATVTTTIDADEVGKVTRKNVCFDSRDIDGAATSDLDDVLGILTSNPFYPVALKSAEVKVEIEPGRHTAQVERVFLKEGKFEPGATAQIGVVIKPYKQPAVTKTIALKLPQNTPSGRYVLQVKGGAVPPGISFGGMILRPNGGQNAEQAPPASIRQMITRYEEKEKQNEMVVRLALLSTSVNVEGERLSNLPPSLDAVMRSSKTSGVKLERDEVKVVEPTDWVVSGQQLIAFTVQRKDNQEAASPAGGSAPTFLSSGNPANLAQSAQPTGDSELTSAGRSTFPSEPDDTPDNSAFTAGLNLDDKIKKDQGKKSSKPDQKSAKKPDASNSVAEEQKTAPSTPAANDQPSAEKPVGRLPQVWRQTSRTDFAKGESVGVAVTTGGDLVLTRRFSPFFSSTESFVWSLVPDDKGGLYVGTGTQAAVLHLTSDGKSTTLARLPEISVHGLSRQADGSLIAGTGPHGRIYRITPDGKFDVVHQTTEKYVLSVAQDSKNRIYAGTGGGSGRIYRMEADGKVHEVLKTAEEHVLCLAIGKDDVLYAGTSPNGLVYRITPDGKATVLYDAGEASITGIGVNAAGDVYAVTAPRGVIYKISADGTAKTLFDKAPAAFTALRVTKDGTVFASSGSAVYLVRPDDTVAIADNKSDVDILTLATSSDGWLYAGTGNVAEVYAAAPPSGRREGTYTSVVHDAKQLSRWGAIRWTAATPSGARLSIATRTGDVAEPDSTWSPWAAPAATGDGAQITSPPGRYIQYRVTIDGEGTVTPTLRDVAISYLPRNQAPRVAFQAPVGGERWAGKQTLKWEGSDPDKDTLSYEVYYSADAGAHWQSLPTDASGGATPQPAKVSVPDPTAAKGSIEAAVPLGSGPPSLATVRAELDKHPDLPPAMRDAILSRAQQVNTDVTAASSVTGGSGSAAGQKEANRAFNTKLLPDGVYLFKVMASDRISNPAEALTAEAVSEPVTICNSAPSVMLFKDSAVVQNGRLSVPGSVVQPRITVSGVQYRVDGGDWVAAVPRDGLFDASSESFTVSSGRLAPGKHTIEVKAFNAAGLTATEKIEIEIK